MSKTVEKESLKDYMASNPKAFFHPDDIIKYIINLVSKYGAGRILHGSKYQQERELLIGSLFVYALREFNKREYYMRAPENDPPDIEFSRAYGKGTGAVFSVEIVEITNKRRKAEVDPCKALGMIVSKFSEDYCIENTELLIFINTNNASEIMDYLVNSEKIKKQKKFKGVWCIFFTRIDSKNGFEYVVKSIKHPETFGTFETRKIALVGERFTSQCNKSYRKEKIKVNA